MLVQSKASFASTLCCAHILINIQQTHTHAFLYPKTFDFYASNWTPAPFCLRHHFLFWHPTTTTTTKKPTVAAEKDSHPSESDWPQTSNFAQTTWAECSGADDHFCCCSYLADAESRRTRGDSWSWAESDVEPDDWLLTDVPYASTRSSADAQCARSDPEPPFSQSKKLLLTSRCCRQTKGSTALSSYRQR